MFATTKFFLASYTHPDVHGKSAYAYTFFYHTEQHEFAFCPDADDVVKVPVATAIVSVVLPIDIKAIDWATRKTITSMVTSEVIKANDYIDWSEFTLHHILKTAVPF